MTAVNLLNPVDDVQVVFVLITEPCDVMTAVKKSSIYCHTAPIAT